MSQKIAIVSGSSAGIGLCIVRALCKHFGANGVVYLTARNEERGMKAVDVLKKEGLNPSFHLLDVNDVASMEKLRDDMKTQHGGFDILVNNAGIDYNKGVNAPMTEMAAGNVKTNYHGVRLMTNIFLPIIRDGGRIVHVASKAGVMVYYTMSEENQQRFKKVSTEQGVTDLLNEYIEATAKGDHKQKGWADWTYGTSKLGVISLTRIQGETLSKDTSKKDVLITCCCPGYVLTDMTAHHGAGPNKTPEEGAVTPVYLSLLPSGTAHLQGKFLSNKTVCNFFEEDIRPVKFD